MVLVDWLFWPAIVGLYAFLGAWTFGYASAAGADRLDSLFIGTGWPISWVMFPVYWVIQTLVVPLLGVVSRLGRIAHDGLPERDAEPDVDLQIESEDERLSREIEEAHKQVESKCTCYMAEYMADLPDVPIRDHSARCAIRDRDSA